MEINDALIDKLSNLARLHFEAGEKEEIKKDLQKMINFVGKLQEVDTEGVEPLVYMTDETLRLRQDEARDETTQEEALKNAPSRDSDYFKVPKVLQK